MSQTYISVFVMIAAQVLPHLGIVIGSDDLTTTITTILTLGAGVWALWRRYQQGDISFAGVRKQSTH